MSVNEKMTAIADAIREKTGDTAKLSLDAMAETIRKLPGLIVATATGNPIALTDATDLKLRGLKLFGKTTQDGTPTPDAPVPLVSAGGGGDIRTLILPAVKTLDDDTLCGIPVTSGGNYTDENGQQWVCDEVDFARGVHIQRVFHIPLDANIFEFWPNHGVRTVNNRSTITFNKMHSIAGANNTGQYGSVMMSNFTDIIGSASIGECVMWENGTNGNMQCSIAFNTEYVPEATESSFIEFFTANPGEILIGMHNPIETALSEEELAAYAEKYGGTGTVYGRTTQDGTPSPESPVELVSHADVCQSILASTPNGLPGIPVTSGGNYTDETGQQWVCDEVDFGRGVYVQRIYKYNFTGNEVLISYDSGKSCGRNFEALGLPFIKIQTEGSANNKSNAMCNVTTVGTQATANNGTAGLGFSSWGGIPTFYFSTAILGNGETLKAAMKTAYDNGNPYSMIYELATPNEIALSAEELAAYAALHTNYPNTTILNDGGAGMEVSYVADTKLYIDNQVAALSAAIVNA